MADLTLRRRLDGLACNSTFTQKEIDGLEVWLDGNPTEDRINVMVARMIWRIDHALPKRLRPLADKMDGMTRKLKYREKYPDAGRIRSSY